MDYGLWTLPNTETSANKRLLGDGDSGGVWFGLRDLSRALLSRTRARTLASLTVTSPRQSLDVCQTTTEQRIASDHCFSFGFPSNCAWNIHYRVRQDGANRIDAFPGGEVLLSVWPIVLPGQHLGDPITPCP